LGLAKTTLRKIRASGNMSKILNQRENRLVLYFSNQLSQRVKKAHTVFPHLVFMETILFCIWKLWQIQIIVAIFQSFT
jgi:hypothetical protein